ncbi:TonB-dependent receptor [Altererythrobacter sp. KTW20L]|uniref:TonB-dependent receptor n=1 Tax=Altererythrobacter sp. KTW20L TaxID=2942210 RepID=UPI0020BF58EC|nr:TonB-dependent receptor [Altererythrobacter sp. KTW20L]MCL6251586.1 TonB-dependent receptor [Altererythrobacter sp. KTW20L]
MTSSFDPARQPGGNSLCAATCCLMPLVLLLAAPAAAQTSPAEDNAVVNADDAFGQSVGNERGGLYDSNDVRGFSPVDAGNGRIEGLYFVQASGPGGRAISGNMIRVGLSAQGYAFPAPTGIVDYSLYSNFGVLGGRVRLEYGQYGSPIALIDGRLPLGPDAGVTFSINLREQERHEGGRAQNTGFGGTVAVRPWEGAQIIAFASEFRFWDDPAAPVVFPDGDFLPPEYRRRELLSQPWALRENINQVFGAVAKLPFGEWQVDAGLFQSGRDIPETYSDLFTRLRADGTTPARIIVADGNNHDDVTSGELRLTRSMVTGRVAHKLMLSARGRQGERQFGGQQRINLGESTLLARDIRERPAIALGAENIDRVRQGSIGLAWSATTPGSFSLDASITQSTYRKEVDFAAIGREDVAIRDNPLTASLTGSLFLTRDLVLYGGHVRGFEDAVVAPDIAVNQGDAPPALRTRQTDLGLRYAFPSGIRLVAGLFSIDKPYFNLDPGQVFRELGSNTNRGVELSLTGQVVPGLNIVAGAVLLDSRISGLLVDSGQIGSRPVGSSRRRIIFDADWRLDGGNSPLSFDISVNSRGSQVANAPGTLLAPGSDIIDLGMRYRFDLAFANLLLRAQVNNVTNAYSWNVTSSGGFVYRPRRHASIALIADF